VLLAGGDDRANRQRGLLLYALHRSGSQGRGSLWVIKFSEVAAASLAVGAGALLCTHQQGEPTEQWPNLRSEGNGDTTSQQVNGTAKV
jgi:hypothetical protein